MRQTVFLVLVAAAIASAAVNQKKTWFDWYESVARLAGEELGWEKYLEGTDARLNSAYLSTHRGQATGDVETDIDHSKNIDESIAILKKDEAKAPSESGKNNARAAIRILEDLKSSIEKCDFESFATLRNADLLTARKAHREPHTPFDIAVRGYMIKHAQFCGPIYLSQLQEQENKLSLSDLKAVNTVTLPIIKVSTGDREFQNKLVTSPTKIIDLVGKLNHLYTWTGAREIFEAIESLIPNGDPMKQDIRGVDNSEGRKTINRRQAEDAFATLIGKPCENYASKLGPIMMPALYDLESLGKPFTLEGAEERILQHFYEAVLKFKVCVSMVGPSNDVSATMIRYAVDSF